MEVPVDGVVVVTCTFAGVLRPDGVERRDPDGTLREWWKDSTRTYYRYDAEGVEVEARPYLAEEIAAAEWRAARFAEQDNRALLEIHLNDDLIALQAIIDDTNANINANPAQRIKVLARADRRLIKLQLEQFDLAE